MTRTLVLVTVMLSFALMGCRTAGRDVSVGDSARHTHSERTAKAGCATCIFGMKDVTGCKLAVEIDGTPYLVVGSDINDHGDAHAADGMCNAAREAVVTGKIEGDRFVADAFELSSH